jgi:hypothetical protein
MAKYLYGIARIGQSEQPPAMTTDRPVKWIRVRDLACAVWDVELLTRYEPTQGDLLLHNRVLEELMEKTAVIPMSIGTIAESGEQVASLLEEGYELFEQALDRIGGKVQFTLDAQWEPEAMQRVAQEDERVARLKAELMAKGGQSTVEDRVKLGGLIASVLGERAPAVRETILGTLQPYAIKHQVIERKHPMFFFSVAFLVGQTRAEEFEQAVRRFGDAQDQHVKITYAGPLAPYNFVELGIALVTNEQLTEAMQLLGLQEPVTIASTKASYRAKALATHPDLVQDASQAKQQFERIHNAYQLLVGFARSQTSNEHQPIRIGGAPAGAARLVVVPQMDAVEV